VTTVFYVREYDLHGKKMGEDRENQLAGNGIKTVEV